MPITITPGQPVAQFGWGLPLQWSSPVSFTGTALFTVSVWGDTDHTMKLGSFHANALFPSGSYILGDSTLQLFQFDPTVAIKDQAPVYFTSTLTQSVTTLDTGTTIGTWNTTAGLHQDLVQSRQAAANGAFLSTDRTTLNAAKANSDTALSNWDTYTSVTLPSINDVLSGITTAVSPVITGATGAVSTTLGQIFSGKLLDLLTTVSLTGGETCDPVDELVSGAGLYGVIVNCTTVPDWYAFTAPGETWCPRDLAVLEITRGGAVLLRHGIHTRSHEVYPLPGIPALSLELDVPIVPPDYRFKVWWGSEVCGEVLLLELP